MPRNVFYRVPRVSLVSPRNGTVICAVLIPISMLPPESQTFLIWIGLPIPPPWYNPSGFFVVVFYLVLLGVEIIFLICAIRRTIYEFREPVRIWWKILIRILLAMGALVFVGFTLLIWVML